jgi:hypothetical protein
MQEEKNYAFHSKKARLLIIFSIAQRNNGAPF